MEEKHRNLLNSTTQLNHLANISNKRGDEVAAAKERQRQAGQQYGENHPKEVRPKSDEPPPQPSTRTDEQLAKKAGTGKTKLRQIGVIEEEGDEETKARVASGEMSVNKAYLYIRGKSDPAPMGGSTFSWRPISGEVVEREEATVVRLSPVPLDPLTGCSALLCATKTAQYRRTLAPVPWRPESLGAGRCTIRDIYPTPQYLVLNTMPIGTGPDGSSGIGTGRYTILDMSFRQSCFSEAR